MDLLSGVLATCMLWVCLFFVAYVAGARVCARLDTPTRWCAALAALAGVCTALFHLLAWTHRFTRVFAGVAAVALALGAWLMSGGYRQIELQLRRDWRFIRWVARHAFRHRYWLAAGFLTACALPAVARTVVLPPLGWDTLTYHAVKAAMWVQHGGGAALEGPGPWAYYRYMPGGAEVLQAWSMLPTSSDAFTSVLDVGEWLAAGLGVMVLARRMGAREPLPSAAAVFVLSLPCLRLMIGSGYSEPFLLSTLVIGLVLVLAADRSPGAFVLGALALGLSASAKVSMLPTTALVLAVAGIREWVRPHGRRVTVVAAAATYLMMVIPWFIASATATGLPLSPFDVRVGSIALGQVPPEFAWYVDRGTAEGFDFARELTVLRQVFASPAHAVDGATFLSVLPLLATPLAWTTVFRKARYAAILLAVVLLSCVAFFYSPGFAPIRLTFGENSSRFLLPAIAAATVVWVGGCRTGSWTARVSWFLLVASAGWNLGEQTFVGFSPVSIRATVEVVAAAAAAGMACYLARFIPRPSIRVAVQVAVILSAMTAALSARDRLRPALMGSDYTLHWFAAWRTWADAAALMDDPREPHRIAVTSGPIQNNDNWFVYPFMGRRLQNEVMYVPVSGDGNVRPFGSPEVYAELVRTADFRSWVGRLEDRHISHVMTFYPPGVEAGWMDTHAERFERVAGSPGDWELFRVRALPASEHSASTGSVTLRHAGAEAGTRSRVGSAPQVEGPQPRSVPRGDAAPTR
jgi:hypothetical protein